VHPLLSADDAGAHGERALSGAHFSSGLPEHFALELFVTDSRVPGPPKVPPDFVRLGATLCVILRD